MANERIQHEAEFVEKFGSFLKKKGMNVRSANCRSKKSADVEFIDANGVHWILEAKTHFSNYEKYNAVHKIFGELLKEEGRQNSNKNTRYGILIEGQKDNNKKSGFQFFQEQFSKTIHKDQFIGFGKLFPGNLTVFVFDSSGKGKLSCYEWGKFYDCKESEEAVINLF